MGMYTTVIRYPSPWVKISTPGAKFFTEGPQLLWHRDWNISTWISEWHACRLLVCFFFCIFLHLLPQLIFKNSCSPFTLFSPLPLQFQTISLATQLLSFNGTFNKNVVFHSRTYLVIPMPTIPCQHICVSLVCPLCIHISVHLYPSQF